MPQPRSVGELAQLACTWEVLARKAGNVCPGREFPDLTVDDFLKSAAAIAPVLDEAPTTPLGLTILHSIEATRKVVNTNTNLGIVLLLAPLASVPLDHPVFWGELERVLDDATVEDSRHVYQAIRLANPAGLGKVDDQDVGDEPTLRLREIMRLAADRDWVAAAFVNPLGWFADYLAELIATLANRFQNVERAIVEAQREMLTRYVDSLIVRKRGLQEAENVRHWASNFVFQGGLDSPAGRRAYRDFDDWLRCEDHARNPGTTADLIAAALFVALREKRIAPSMPFTWERHPFDDPN